MIVCVGSKRVPASSGGGKYRSRARKESLSFANSPRRPFEKKFCLRLSPGDRPCRRRPRRRGNSTRGRRRWCVATEEAAFSFSSHRKKKKTRRRASRSFSSPARVCCASRAPPRASRRLRTCGACRRRPRASPRARPWSPPRPPSLRPARPRAPRARAGARNAPPPRRLANHAPPSKRLVAGRSPPARSPRRASLRSRDARDPPQLRARATPRRALSRRSLVPTIHASRVLCSLHSDALFEAPSLFF
mmetsp:Transcript_6049/g.24518  ORF Transcript_6049/g.24518 Transcript_6049/m.24518 type:complete len:247 (-) Transcript_6049:398-1138(-)